MTAAMTVFARLFSSLLVADFDIEKAFRKSLRVEQQSTFVIFKNGREVARSMAELDRDTLSRTFAKAL